MFFSMGVSLFTSRIVLQNLGVDNYGIYTVVGGFVALFAFLNGPLNAAASRFFAFELGKGQGENLKTVFRSALFTHLFYAFIAVILLEIVGLYLFKSKLVIPPERMTAAVWVFHLSVVGVFVTIVQTPLVALIIATERMKVYAYLGIVDVVVNLCVVAAIVFTKGDKLVFYAFLLLVTNALVFMIYHFYCSRNIKDRYSVRPLVNWKLQKEMLGFTGWSMMSSASLVLKTQGINMLFNIYFGVAVNAALGIANQVNGALTKFLNNFTTAMNPQIVKRYSSGDFNGMNSLIVRGAKFSFFLLFLVALPVLFSTEYLLNIWLVEVPHYAAIFTKLLIIDALIKSFINTIGTAVSATGDIMMWQLVLGGIQLSILPVSYLFLKLGYPPTVAFYVLILSCSVNILIGILITKIKVPCFSARKFLFSVLGTSALVAALSFMPPFVIKKYITETWIAFFVISAVCVLSTSLSIIFVGLNKHERMWFCEKSKALFRRSAVESAV
jgi:O-antigen/teichoic acid export membrane protein